MGSGLGLQVHLFLKPPPAKILSGNLIPRSSRPKCSWNTSTRVQVMASSHEFQVQLFFRLLPARILSRSLFPRGSRFQVRVSWSRLQFRVFLRNPPTRILLRSSPCEGPASCQEASPHEGPSSMSGYCFPLISR